MLAFVLEGGRARLVADRPRPVLREGYTRVRVRAAGICNTDLELARGYMSYQGVLGHEFVGEAMDGSLAGQRVVAEINFACGLCDQCTTGLRRHCSRRRVMGIVDADGALAEEVVVPVENLHSVPQTIGDEAAVFVEPLAAACEILEQLGADRRRGAAAVLGAGKLGPLVAQVLAADGYDVVLIGRRLESVQWLLGRAVRLAFPDLVHRQYDLVVDATGSREGLQRAIAMTAPRGTLVLKTTIAGAHEVDLAPVVINEIRILGSRCGSFAPAIGLLSAGAVDVAALVTDRYPLSQVDEAFARAASPGARKVIVTVS